MHEFVKSRLLRLLRVPAEPHPPDGSPESIAIFRAGRNFYHWKLAQFLLTRAGLLVLLALLFLAPLLGKKSHSPAAVLAYQLSLAGTAAAFASAVTIGYFRLRLDYEMRWYIVTDRSLRTRSGIWNVRELTMTFANIQEIRVNAGPLQRLFGLGDVVVTSAGSGGSEQLGTSHNARFEGVDNAEAIRDLLIGRIRQYKDTGLGDPDVPMAANPNPTGAARELLAQARALRLKMVPGALLD